MSKTPKRSTPTRRSPPPNNDEQVQPVGKPFGKFLKRELSCGATGCRWYWFKENQKYYVGCLACGSQYPWRDTYYLKRIFLLENPDDQ